MGLPAQRPRVRLKSEQQQQGPVLTGEALAEHKKNNSALMLLALSASLTEEELLKTVERLPHLLEV